MSVLGQRGEDVGEIACILGITERTVNYHLNQVTRKTGSMNRYQAVAKGVSSGILLRNLEQVVVTNFPQVAAVSADRVAHSRRSIFFPVASSPSHPYFLSRRLSGLCQGAWCQILPLTARRRATSRSGHGIFECTRKMNEFL